jgi:hypothetical protein
MKGMAKKDRAPLKPKYWGLKALVGALFVAICAYSVYDYVSFEGVAFHEKGRVVSVQHETKATGRRGNRVAIDHPMVKFTLPSTHEEITARAKVRSSTSFHAGEEVDVEFDPSRPAETVRIDSGLSLLELGFGVAGLLLVYWGASEKLRWSRALKGGV